MFNINDIEEHADVVGADGAHVGTVDGIEGDRIKLTRGENPSGHTDHHHYISISNIASVEGGRVKLSVNGPDAIEEKSGAEFH